MDWLGLKEGYFSKKYMIYVNLLYKVFYFNFYSFQGEEKYSATYIWAQEMVQEYDDGDMKNFSFATSFCNEVPSSSSHQAEVTRKAQVYLK